MAINVIISVNLLITKKVNKFFVQISFDSRNKFNSYDQTNMILELLSGNGPCPIKISGALIMLIDCAGPFNS